MRKFQVRLDTKTVQLVMAEEFIEDGAWFIFRTNNAEVARFAKASVVSIMDSDAEPKRSTSF